MPSNSSIRRPRSSPPGFRRWNAWRKDRGLEFGSLTLAQMDLLWEETKAAEPEGAPPSAFADAARRVRFTDA